MSFVARTLMALIPSDIPFAGWVMLYCVLVIPLGWVRELKWFSFTSIFGLLSMLFTVSSVIANGVMNPTPMQPLPLFPSDLFLFLGIAAFGYAGIAISISVENSMAKPMDFSKMIAGTFATVTIVYVGFGVAGFYLYGSNAQSVISCIIHGPLGTAVKVALILQLSFALPLNFHPIWTTVEPPVQSRLEARKASPRTIFWIVNLQRAILTALFGVLAFSIPYFGISSCFFFLFFFKARLFFLFSGDFSNLVGE